MLRILPIMLIRCTFALCVLLLSACGGSQQSLPVTGARPPTGGTDKGAAFSRVTVVVKLPPGRKATSAIREAAFSRQASSRRSPLFISPAISSVTVSVSATGSPTTSVTSNVVCSTTPPPSCTVTATILAPVQKQDTFAIVAYDAPNATGNILSQNSIVYNVPAGATQQLPIVLQGTVASIVAVNVSNANPVTGSSATSPVSVTAADADGYVIAGQYTAPITLQLLENDSEGLLSFVQGGFIQTTATVSSSTTTVDVYLKAKADVTTPDDGTIVATLPNAPYVPGTPPNPPLASLGEITTVCPTSSITCVYYPNAYQKLAAQATNLNGNPGNADSWGAPLVVPGTVADPSPGNSIWSVLYGINNFDTATSTFNVITSTTPAVSAVTDIAGTFWGVLSDANTGAIDMVNFTTSGATLATYPTAAVQSLFGSSSGIASTFDAYGQLWALFSGALFAVNPSTGATQLCNFEPTDVNFAQASITSLAVAGATVWVGVSGSADGLNYVNYVFKVPAQVPSGGCDLTALEHPATEFSVIAQLGSEDTFSIVTDSAGDAFALQATAVTKITPGGVALKLVDTGLSGSQTFQGIALAGTNLYLVDFQEGNGTPVGTGTLDRASATVATANPLPAFKLPPVFDLPNCGCLSSPLYYQPFFTSDGSFWIGAAPFANPAQPFTLLGSPQSSTGGLVRINLGNITFAAGKIMPTSIDRARLLRLLHPKRTRRSVERRASFSL